MKSLSVRDLLKIGMRQTPAESPRECVAALVRDARMISFLKAAAQAALVPFSQEGFVGDEPGSRLLAYHGSEGLSVCNQVRVQDPAAGSYMLLRAMFGARWIANDGIIIGVHLGCYAPTPDFAQGRQNVPQSICPEVELGKAMSMTGEVFPPASPATWTTHCIELLHLDEQSFQGPTATADTVHAMQLLANQVVQCLAH